ncbi:MAG: DNA cytosine methyltransferase [Candidatus Accumulibacter sp.]|nr:DNA cytosine methyltransferase [Accumulibacter sp.]
METFAVESCTGAVAPTLTADNEGKRGSIVAFAQSSDGELRLSSGNGEIAGTLLKSRKLGQGCSLVLSLALRGREGGMMAELGGERANALLAALGSVGKGCVLQADAGCPVCRAAGRLWRARRLMPVECERLQGMPDEYTRIPWRGRPAADTPRYRAIGNSMAVPCMAWIGRRLQFALRTEIGEGASSV